MVWADKARIGPLLHRALVEAHLEASVSPGPWESLLHSVRKQRDRTAGRLARLAEVLRAFAARGIDVAVLKGAALGRLVYEDLALRTMADVDLLIRRSDLGAAREAIRALGYRPENTIRSPDWYVDHHHHLVPHIASDGGLTLEIHFEIMPAQEWAEPTQALLARARKACFGGAEALVPASDDLLVHAALHIAQHGFFPGLRGLADIARIADRLGEELPWSRFIDTAKRSGRGVALHCALRSAQDLVAAPIPPRVLEALAEAGPRGPIEPPILAALVRAAVLYQPDRSALPEWALARVCATLLKSTPLSAKVGEAAVEVARVYLAESRTRAAQVGRPVWQTVLLRLGFLLRREATQFRKRQAARPGG